MNKKTNIQTLYTYILTLTFLVLLLIPLSYADDDDRQYMGMGYGHMGSEHMGYRHMGSGHMGRMGMGYRYLHSLDLSDQQRTDIRNIHKEMRTQQFSLQDKIAEKKDDLHSLYKKDKPNAKKIGAVYKKIFDLKRQQIELAVTTKNKTYDFLNKKQKEKLKELKSSDTGNRTYKGMHGRGMHHMMD